MRENSEIIQKELFESIGDQYLIHYNDHYSRLYREMFIYSPMVKGLSLNGKIILDAMCGSGQISEFVAGNRCTLHGLDISEKQMEIYGSRFPEALSHVRSILDTGFEDESFDIVMMCGGLHHVHPYVNDAIREIGRILRPGGMFLFTEPHAYTAVDKIRRFWYATDRFFMSNEAAVDYHALEREFRGMFESVSVEYFGNIAYYLVYNSLILRVPLRLKKIIAPSAIRLESALLPLQNHFLSSYLVAQWRKK